MSYCDWEYVNDASMCYQFYEQGYLPEVWDTQYNKPCSILDQTDFFHKSFNIVSKVKNKAEKKRMDDSKRTSKSK